MIKKLIFIFILVILFLPLLQKEYKLLSFKELEGTFVNTSKKPFTLNNWLSGEFQKNLDANITDSVGFKEFFVRLNNELGYRIFGVARSPKVVLGKENYIYLQSYIDSYYGYNFTGLKKIKNKVQKLRSIQDFFKNNNISFFIVFTPSKASFYPEYIPCVFKKQKHTNYETYIKMFEQYGINHLDLNKYFGTIKNKTQYPLFPKNGLHWTSYGMAVAMDTLIKKIEEYRNIKLPGFSWEEPVELTDSTIKPDRDAEKLMNLFSELQQSKMPLMKFKYKTNNNTIKPKVLVISDSYYWQTYEQGVHRNEFSYGGFWYYYKTAYQGGAPVKVNSFNIKEKLLSQDVIILFASDATLNIFPFGFEQFYEDIMKKDTLSLKKYFINELKTNKLEEIKNKAHKNNISIQEQLNIDAEYLTKKFLAKSDKKTTTTTKTGDYRLLTEYYIHKLYSDSINIISLKKEAAAKHTDLDNIIQNNAGNMAKNSDKKLPQLYNSVLKQIIRIKNDTNWLEKVKQKAINNKTDINTQLIMESEYLLIQNNKIPATDKEIITKINEIRKNTVWYKKIKQKAINNNYSEYEQLIYDAMFVLNQ